MAPFGVRATCIGIQEEEKALSADLKQFFLMSFSGVCGLPERNRPLSFIHEHQSQIKLLLLVNAMSRAHKEREAHVLVPQSQKYTKYHQQQFPWEK